MEVNEAKKLKEPKRENTEFKKMPIDAMRAKRVLEYALGKNCEPVA
jgi:hypothetical protein